MAKLAAAAAVIGTVAQVAGTVVQGKAIKQQGQREQEAAEYEATQLERSAKEEFAASQRESFEIGRQTDLLKSRQQALAAASGAGASDLSILDAMSDVERQGNYRRGLSLYGGIQRAKGYRAQAEASRKAGRASLAGAQLAATGTILGGIGSAAANAASFYFQYGGGRPSPGAATVKPPTRY